MNDMKKIALIASAIVILVAAWYFWPAGNTPGLDFNNASEDMITLDIIRPGVNVLPTFTVTGKARGPWYFEASFPLEVLDKDGKQIAQGIAQADGDWMTEGFVPFSAPISVENYAGPATLILHKDNPSGDPERDASLSVSIEIMRVGN